MSQQEVKVEGDTLTIKRVFAAPVEKVYQAWVDPNKASKWLSPNVRWRQPLLERDAKVGGRYDLTMRHSDGDQFHLFGTYQEIVPNERLSFTWNSVEMPEYPESVVTLLFRPVAEGTELTLIHDRLTDPANREQTQGGWIGCLEMLAAYVEEGKELPPYVGSKTA